MTTTVQKMVLNRLLRKLDIKPATEKSNAEKFHDWLRKCGNIHMANQEQMARAYARIIE
jgi:hypothetical protein